MSLCVAFGFTRRDHQTFDHAQQGRAKFRGRSTYRGRMSLALAPRSIKETHRASTPLELFFDLCFVVAVAQAAVALHHAIAEDHWTTAVIAYPMVFFAIWWAWMNLTWFASAYDNDDVGYRLAIFVQVFGVLVLAAGVPRGFDDQDYGTIFIGYTIIRLSMISLWLRAAAGDPERRATCLRYAGGLAVVQCMWLGFLLLPHSVQLPGFLVLVALELSLPMWAERAGVTPWNPEHIAERYGLFTIIVLGESILGTSLALQAAISNGESLLNLTVTGLGAVVIVCAMWWLYFNQASESLVGRARAQFEQQNTRSAFLWGYGHYVIFAAVAATGAGIAVAIDVTSQSADISASMGNFGVAIPLAIYVCAMGLLHQHQGAKSRLWIYIAGAVSLLGYAATGGPIIGFGIVLVLVVIAGRIRIPAEGPLLAV